jgi:hypothetical protein
MAGFTPLGPHEYRIEEDLLYWRPAVEVTAEHAAGVCALFAQIMARFGHVLWLIDAEKSIPVGPATRRVYANWMESMPGRLFVAAFRPPMLARTMAELVVRATMLVSGKEIIMAHFATEPEARDYLRTQREKYLAQEAATASPDAAS